jgi:hypothetical protein
VKDRRGASEPTRLVDLDDGAFSSMGSDLRVARGAAASYDVDAGLAKFSALVAAAPIAAAIGSAAGSAVGNAAPGGVAALVEAAPAALGASGSTVATTAVSTAAATSAAATGTAAKLAVAAKLGFGMKTLVAAMIATGAVGVAGYEIASSPPARDDAVVTAPERPVANDAPRARAPLDTPGPVPAPVEVSEPVEAPVEAPVVAPSVPIEAHPETETETATPATPPTSSHATPGAPTANGAVASSVKPEVEQLAKVRGAGSPAQQLKLAEEGHRLFPRGVFFQEREAIAIDALSKLGRGGEAAERARAFVARYPKSPYVETFRRIAGE